MALTAEQTKTLEHVGYEWWMFRATHDCLKGWPAPTPPGEEDPIRNAVLESLVIHGGNLIDFFHRRPDPRKGDLHCEMVGVRRRDMLTSRPLERPGPFARATCAPKTHGTGRGTFARSRSNVPRGSCPAFRAISTMRQPENPRLARFLKWAKRGPDDVRILERQLPVVEEGDSRPPRFASRRPS
jgi:hypothetical protein